MSFETINWPQLQSRFDELGTQLTDPHLERSKRVALQKEHSFLQEILAAYKELDATQKKLEALAKQQEENTDPAMNELFEEEHETLMTAYNSHTAELENLLFPPNQEDNLSVFLEIRAGAGGQEAALFAGDLARMYMMYALKKNWKASIVDESTTDLGGYKEVILHIQGKGVYGELKQESGVHRVQRVPSTETSGRVHTSTATVAVLPEIEEVKEVIIDPSDLRIDVYRASGAGGQHVNKTDSAVRITHMPSGIVVACQDERSQHKNKAKAMKILKTRLYKAHREKQEAEQTQKRREQVGTGMRAEKVRTYNYPQNRVSDHQVDLTLNKLDLIMEGNLEDIVHALQNKERQDRRARGFTYQLTS